ncbi:MAG: hypothetical protein KKI08_15485, partial [Armatimonadetes bacterium]|nr:hypothetical protein [Armatimonadota bacterium]
VIAAGFALCLAVVPPASRSGVDQLNSEFLRGLSLGLPVCFALGLMWAGVFNSVIGAGFLGAVTAAGLAWFGFWFFGAYLPREWGPYVGMETLSVQTVSVLIVSALAISLLAGAWTFSRVPLLETRRRLATALGLWAGLTLLASMGYVGWMLAARRPALQTGLSGVELTENGRFLALSTAPGAGRDGGVWVLPITGGQPRLVARGTTWIGQGTEALVFSYGKDSAQSYWAFGLPFGRLHRLEGDPIAQSPDGGYWALMEQPGVVIRDRRGRQMTVIHNYGEVTFSPDGRTLYYGLEDGRLLARDLPAGAERLVTTLEGLSIPVALSPDGRLLAVVTRIQSAPTSRTVLVDVQTGRQRPFPPLLRPTGIPFVGDFLWCHQKAPGKTYRTTGLVVLKPATMRPVTAIPDVALGGMPLGPWQREGVPYVLLAAVPPREGPPPNIEPPRRLWMANPDGSGLRFLRVEARRMLGMAADGSVILWDDGRELIRWDPRTNEERVIARL